MVITMCSTSLPGGNQVDGLPPVSNTAVMDIRFEIGQHCFARENSFLLDFKYVSVGRIVN
jgi:hypothetical protein